MSHTAKIILIILNRHLRSKIEDELEEEQFGFRKGKGTRAAIGLIRTIGERYIVKDVYAVFVDLKKAFDRVDWKKLIEILKKTGVDWKERRLLSNLYMKQRIKVRIGEEILEGRETGRGTARMSSIDYTLQHLLGRFNEERFPENGGGV